MNFRNLKLHTAFILFVIITLAMLLINSIIMIFWFEHVLSHQYKSIQNILKNNQTAVEKLLIAKTPDSLNKIGLILGIDHFHINQITINKSSDTKNDEIQLVTQPISKIVKTFQPIGASQENKRLVPTLFSKKRDMMFNLAPHEPTTDHNVVTVQIDTSHIFQQLWTKEKIILIYLIFNSFILTIIIFFRFRKIVFAPIDNLLNVANNYQLHEGIMTIPYSQSGELHQLSQAMNAMVLRIEKDRNKLVETVNELKQTNKELKLAQQETILAEKLASTGRLAAGFAHEIGNPVTIIQGYLELLQNNQFSEKEKCEFLNRSLAELTRIDSLLFQLMNLSKGKFENKSIVSPLKVCKELVETLQSNLSKNNINVLLNSKNDSLACFCDPEQLRQVILNLFLNSIDAILANIPMRSGEISCNFSDKTLENTEYIVIQFTDNGIGLAEHTIDTIFDPFFTTKPVGEGTGLGLSVAHRIIESLGGHIEVQSLELHGTTFTLYIPQHTEEQSHE